MTAAAGPVMQHVGRLLAQRCDSNRLVKGYELWDDQCVRDLRAGPGGITAVVVGSRPSPYEVSITWTGAVDVFTDWPDDTRALRFRCDCPDWGDPCKHAVAVALAAAERGDRQDPDDVAPVAVRPEPATLPVMDERPAWAENLTTPPPARSVDEWLGATVPQCRPLFAEGDPMEHYIGLGSLQVDGVDLAAAIQLLVLRLIEPHTEDL